MTASSTSANLDVIRQIEDHRLLDDPRLLAFLSSTDPSVAVGSGHRRGRIGDPSLQPT